MALKRFGVSNLRIIALSALVSCTSKQADVQPQAGSTTDTSVKVNSSASSSIGTAGILIGPNDSLCDPVTGPVPNAAIIGHWYANDIRSHRKTFGRTPPDSASVRLVRDSAQTLRAQGYRLRSFYEGRKAVRQIKPRPQQSLLRGRSIRAR